jgi:hypothetical protein
MIEILRNNIPVLEQRRFLRASGMLAISLLSLSCTRGSNDSIDAQSTTHTTLASESSLREYPCPRILEVVRKGDLSVIAQSPGETNYSYTIELLQLPDNAIRVSKFDLEGEKRLQVDFPAEEIELDATTTFEVPDHRDVSIAVSVTATRLPDDYINTHFDVSVCGLVDETKHE